MTLMIILLGASGIAAAVCLVIAARLRRHMQQYRYLQSLMAEQNTVLQQNAEQLETIHRIQHDAQNYYLTIRYLLENGRRDEALQYIGEIREWIPIMQEKRPVLSLDDIES